MTRWNFARAKARLLGILIGVFELNRVPRPVVYDVWPDLFQPRTGERSPRSLNAAFRSDFPCTVPGENGPVSVCTVGCAHQDPSTLEGRETTVQGVSETC
jgi:hypothetical protein